MDQSKWSIPRVRQMTKSLSKYDRPRSKIQGVWLHGVALFLWVLDPRSGADASMVVEALMRSLDRMEEMLAEKGRPRVRRLLLWAPGHSASFLNREA